jgi:hypothetical protein
MRRRDEEIGGGEDVFCLAVELCIEEIDEDEIS